MARNSTLKPYNLVVEETVVYQRKPGGDVVVKDVKSAHPYPWRADIIVVIKR